ncbi:MAG: TRAP transporter large permease subunit, partial [Treponema sp.]|nr:TRAP transporter large permease subunit [Treponema sp.]
MVALYTTVFLASLVVSIMLGLPIAFSLILSGVSTALAMGGNATNPQTVAAQLMRGTDSVTMMALPFFVLAGELMNKGGLTRRIIAFCNIFVGRVRGGLGYVTILACLMFASLVGSAVASTAALGAILIPMMANSGYNRAKAAGLVASANIVAPIMPPSIPMIVYGVAAGVSIKSLFMGGIAPAIYLTVGMSVVWYVVSRKDAVKSDAPKPTLKETLKIFF